MKAKANPALLMGIAMAALWVIVWLVGYLLGFSGEPDSFRI